MVQRGEKARLALESLQRSGILREVRRQRFDRHLTPEPAVVRAVDISHPARTERLHHFERANARSAGDVHVPSTIRRSGSSLAAPCEMRCAAVVLALVLTAVCETARLP